MFISPKVAIEQGWITGIRNEKLQVQPNAIDFTLDVIQTIDPEGVAYIGEDTKVMRKCVALDPVDGKWNLAGQRVYDAMSDMYVKVPKGVAAFLVPRSTFARNGVILASGLYDTGYEGHIGFTIYTHGGAIDVQKGVRYGQIVFVASDSVGEYAGGWNHARGTTWDSKTPAEQLEQATRLDTTLGSKPAGQQSFI